MHGTSAEMTGNNWNVPHVPRPRIIAPLTLANMFSQFNYSDFSTLFRLLNSNVTEKDDVPLWGTFR